MGDIEVVDEGFSGNHVEIPFRQCKPLTHVGCVATGHWNLLGEAHTMGEHSYVCNRSSNYSSISLLKTISLLVVIWLECNTSLGLFYTLSSPFLELQVTSAQAMRLKFIAQGKNDVSNMVGRGSNLRPSKCKSSSRNKRRRHLKLD